MSAERTAEECLAIFQQVLIDESQAIAASAQRIPPEVVGCAVGLIEKCTGKVVLLGVGKSGIIARKIAATLASVGITAMFIHAADAVHGDLGSISSNDIVLMISNSGETDELTALLPHLHRRDVGIVAIVGNMKSTIARHAIAVLNAGVDREACPLNLAPTSSTAVALAIGDALAMTVARRRGITSDEFAINHPSGRIGKRLTLRVYDVVDPATSGAAVSPSMPVIQVAGVISEFGAGAVAVIDETRRILGVITDGDIRRNLGRMSREHPDAFEARDIMSENPIVIGASDLAYNALRLMEHRSRQIAVIPVLSSDFKYSGILRLHDLVKRGL